tara:strand:- start:9 stop:467 length:459 start_codon:yes stop_codon:yes gene_type:complete
MEVRVYTSNKNMSPQARQAHVRNLANIRQKKRYRKVKMERFKKNTLITQKVDLNSRTADILMDDTYTDTDDETDTDTDTDVDDEEVLVYLMDDLNGVDDTATLHLIDLIEDKLGITDKLNADGLFNELQSSSDEESDSETESEDIETETETE